MSHWYYQELNRMKQQKQEQRRSRIERILLLWILLLSAGILMLLSGIVSYHLCRMFMHR